MRYCMVLGLTIIGLALGQQKAQSDQRAAAEEATDVQATGPMTHTQGEPGQAMKDQAVIYYFRLAGVETQQTLTVSNLSDEAGFFALAALDGVGRASGSVRKVVGAGESVRLSSQEARWPEADCVYVKASRRLELSLGFGEGVPEIRIAIRPNAAVYDVVSAERLHELAPGEHKRALQRLTPPGRLPSGALGDTGPVGVAEPLRNVPGGAEAPRGLYLAYAQK